MNKKEDITIKIKIKKVIKKVINKIKYYKRDKINLNKGNIIKKDK